MTRRIDALLTSARRFKATGVVLTSGAAVHLRFPGGDRPTNQTISHVDLTAMVEQIAPAAAMARVRAGSLADFPYELDGDSYTVRIAPRKDGWRVAVEQADGAAIAAAAAPGAATGAAPGLAPAPAAAPRSIAMPSIEMPSVGTPVADVPGLDSLLPVERMLLQMIERGAADLHLSSGNVPRVRMGEESRELGPEHGVLDDEAIVALVSPIMPEKNRAEFRQRNATDFTYMLPAQGQFGVHLFRDQRGPAAVFEPIGQQAAAAAAPARAPAARARPEPIAVSEASAAARSRIDRMLVQMKERGASDLHLSAGQPPKVRIHGEIQDLGPEHRAIGAEEMLALLDPIIPDKNRREFEERSDADFAHAIPGVSRFRVNLFRDRHGPGAVLRAIPFEILSPDQLGLPPSVLELCFLTKGLVLVTGPTGSGKSTTLATLVDHVNRSRKDHIITIEDPIEFVHENKGCLVNQREVHTHTRSFKDALRAALREDPDIVLVGEMRDLETIAIAVETAETGHLVFGTMHTTTAPSTVDRIIDQFSADRQEQIRQMVAESLRGVVAQVLCRKIGGGRVAAYEILLGSAAVSNLVREGKTFQLFSIMQTGRAQGMITLGDSLIDLVKRKVIEPREAYLKAVNKAEMKGMLQREGHSIDVAAG